MRTAEAVRDVMVVAAVTEADMETPVSEVNNTFDAKGVFPRHTSVPGVVSALLPQEDVPIFGSAVVN
ncbi:hypothetical protein PA03_10820 [Cutibacterium acnes P03]|nr:hypothetical protein [Cutibacterium acnes P03]